MSLLMPSRAAKEQLLAAAGTSRNEVERAENTPYLPNHPGKNEIMVLPAQCPIAQPNLTVKLVSLPVYIVY
jgi:hypothetical protein